MKKTINITATTHQLLRDYCMKTGQKMQAVADKALAAHLRRIAR